MCSVMPRFDCRVTPRILRDCTLDMPGSGEGIAIRLRGFVKTISQVLDGLRCILLLEAHVLTLASSVGMEVVLEAGIIR